MAARLWALFVLGDLVFAAVATAALGRHGSFTPPASLAVGFAVLLAVPALFVLASFLGLAVAGAAAHELDPLRLLHALFTEWFDFDRAILAMIAAPWLDHRDRDARSAGRGARPVFLIHGVLCNRGIWRPWLGPLRAAGFGPVRAVDLEPLFEDLETHAQTVATALAALQRECGGARVTIIAHSMGGLVARAALRRAGPAVVRDIATIASPHHGTLLAYLLPGRAARQMRPRSPWLRALAADEAAHAKVPITSIYSVQDDLIVPARSAVLDGGRKVQFGGVGHLGALCRRRCIHAALAAIAVPAQR